MHREAAASVASPLGNREWSPSRIPVVRHTRFKSVSSLAFSVIVEFGWFGAVSNIVKDV